MPDRHTPVPGPASPADLAVLALRYAAGDLPVGERDAFESRLAEEQVARDALAEAIRLSASALGQALPAPSTAVRRRVRERLFPTRLARLFPRRSYRGHPAAWAGLGGALSAGVAVAVVSLGGDPQSVPLTGPPAVVRLPPVPFPLAPSETHPDAAGRSEPVPPMPPVAGPNGVPDVGMQHGCDPANG